jgi:lysophospholipase L1-like esterase
LENRNKRALHFTVASFFIYLFTSVLFQVFGWSWEPFDRINLVSEVFRKKEKPKDSLIAQPKIEIREKPTQDFELYKSPNLITNFYTDNSAALPQFIEKLRQLKNGKNIKIRIAYFGDSMIEGDLMTQNLRKLLQQKYGGSGVGFVPISSNVAGFRQTVTSSASGWDDANFKTKNARNLYFSGHIFTGNGSGSYTDNTIANPQAIIEKSIIFGKTESGNLTANGVEFNLNGTQFVNKKVLFKDQSRLLRIKNNTAATPLFGISFESETGIFVDNFSFRGITGIELNRLDENFLQSVQQTNHYDLIVFQYGVNLLFRPKDTNYNYYAKLMDPVLKKFKNAFPDSDFLIVSAADRAFRYDGEYKTAIGLPNLLEIQAKLALDNGFAFYNQFETMGGENSIVKWANENPRLANKDYVHPNGRGADILGEKLFEAIVKLEGKK